MPGKHPKGTNDADGDGKKGGSLPEAAEKRIAKLEADMANLRELARANGWSHA